MPDVNGLDELLEKLRGLELTTQKKWIARAVRQGGELIAEEAASLAPVDTGKLKDNIIVTVTEQTATESIGKIGPSKQVFYGSFQETGTAFQPAQPFLIPAYERKHDEALATMAQYLKTQIESEATKG